MRRIIVVTGCSSGFGRQAAEDLARGGDCVYATMRGVAGKNAAIAKELSALAMSEKLDLRVLELDVSSTNSVDQAAARVLAESGAPDVLINNAGQLFTGITEAFSAEEFTRQLDVNVIGVHRANRAFLPAMRKRGTGLVINVSSIAGRMGVPFFGIYHASKWALEGYSMALRAELASSGIDVVLVQPGPFPTELFHTGPKPADSERRAESYPALVPKAFEDMGKAFEELFGQADAPTDPGLVVERMVELVAMKAGSRPFRNVVGLDFGVRGLNAAAAPFEAEAVESFGLTEFSKLAPRAS
jgi:NAD(P)-dependent dehydrogenase (short-subunit alcohol dehydrogenase family)